MPSMSFLRASRRSALVSLALVVSLSGCSKIEEAHDDAKGAVSTASKVKACAELGAMAVKTLAEAQTDQAQAQKTAQDLVETAKKVDDGTIRAAGGRLATSLQKLAKTPSSNKAAVAAARKEAQSAGDATAEACGVPKSVFTG